MWSRLLMIVLAGVLLASCGSKRRTSVPTGVSGSEATRTNIAEMEINNLDFQSFSGRARTNVSLGKQSHNVTVHVRIDRDKAIWMSVTALLGIEAARVLITPDSVKILNKLRGEYIKKDFAYIYQYTSPCITFSTLQDLLLANVSTALLTTDQLTVATSGEGVQLVGVQDEIAFQYGLNNDFRPRAFRLNPLGTDQQVEAIYGSFADVNGYLFPQAQNIKFSAEEMKVEAQLQYNKVAFDEELDFPFTVPASYKVID